MDKSKLIFISPETCPQSEPMTRPEILEQYQRAFNTVNRRLFNNELPPIKIDYPNEDEWRDDCSACFYYDTDHKNPPIIYLNYFWPAELGIGTDDIDDLCHELIHYYCYIHGIKDYDPPRYHNLQFKQTAENHGATCSYSDEINGYNMAKWPDEILWEILKGL